MITTVFLDAYGTLLSAGTGSLDASRKILEKAGSGVDPVEFYSGWKQLYKRYTAPDTDFIPETEVFARGLRTLYERYGIESDWQSDIEIMYSSFYGRKLFDDTLSAVAELKRRYRVYIASNTDTEPLITNMHENGLFVDRVFTSEQLRCYKPSPRFYETVLALSGCRAEECVFIGDSVNEDVLAPQLCGMKALLIDRKRSFDPADFPAIKPSQVLYSLPRSL